MNEGTSPSNLPDWAEPSRRGTSPEGSSAPGGASVTQSFGDIGSPNTQPTATAPPGPPADPQQVPVDGGLALLAAAGAGYAIRKLNEEDEEDEIP